MTILTRAAKGSALTYNEMDANFIDTRDALAASSGSGLMGHTASGTGAVPTTVQEVLRRRVSIFDYISAAEKADYLSNTGSMDITYAFALAWAVGDEIYCPAGTCLVDNLSWPALPNAVRKSIQGEGLESTFFKQKDVTRPAVYMYANATTGQLRGNNFKGVCIVGTGTAGTVASFVVGATLPYVVTDADVDIKVKNSNTAFEIATSGGADIVYHNKFKVTSESSAKTAIKTSGAYNEYDFFATGCADGTSLYDGTTQGIFKRCITDGQQVYAGQNCSINLPTIETIFGTAVYSAMQFIGYNHTIIRPTLTNVSNAKLTAQYGFTIYNQHTIIEPRAWGANYAVYPFEVNSNGAASTIIGGSVLCTNKLEAYLSADILQKLTLVGDVSTYSIRNRNTAGDYNYQTGATYTVDANKATKGLDTHVVSGATGTLTLTLPSGANQVGRKLRVSTRVAQTVVSASANIIPMTGGGTVNILAATVGKWAELQYDGTNWNIIGYN